MSTEPEPINLNHLHLFDVFEGCRDRVDDAVYEQLCRIVAQSWRMVVTE